MLIGFHTYAFPDSPWGDQKAAVDRVSALPISDSRKEKIVSKNAVRLLGLAAAK